MENIIKNTVNADKLNVDICIVGKTFAITLPITMKALKQIERYRPEALQLKDSDGGLKFRVASGINGSITDFGVTFNDFTRDERKLAFMSVELNGDMENAREYIAAEYVGALLNLKNIISSFGMVADEIEDVMEEVKGYIRYADSFGNNSVTEEENKND